MKNIFRNLALLFVFLVVPFGFVACKDEVKVSSYEIVNIESEVQLNGDIDLENAILRLNMSNKTVIEIPIDLDMVVLPDLTTEGEKQLIVKYNGVEYKFLINVVNESSGGGDSGNEGQEPEVTIVSYEFVNKTTSFNYGEKFRYDGLKLKLTMSDDTVKTINVTESMIVKPDMSSVGEKVVIVNYLGEQYTYTIEVIRSIKNFLEEFLAVYVANGGANDASIKLLTDIESILLNEQGNLKSEFEKFEFSKEEINDDFIDLIYSSITDGLFFESLNMKDFEINQESVKATIDLFETIKRIFDNTKNFNVINYVFDKVAPNGTEEYVKELTNVSAEALNLSASGTVKLNVYYTLIIQDLREKNEFNFIENVKKFNEIVKAGSKDSEIIETIDSIAQTIIDVFENNSLDNLEASLKAGLKHVEVVYALEEVSTLEQNQIELLSENIVNSFIDLFKVIKNFDNNNSVESVDKIIETITQIQSYCSQAEDNGWGVVRFVDVINRSILSDVKYALELYTGDIVSDITTLLKDYEVIENYVTMISNSQEVNDVLVPLLYELIETQAVDSSKVEELIKEIALAYGLTEEETNEYIEFFEENGYVNILSKHLAEQKQDAIDVLKECFNFDDQHAEAVFNNILRVYEIIERMHQEFDFAELTYNVYNVMNEIVNSPEQPEGSVANENISAIISICKTICPLIKTNYDEQNNLYSINLESNILAIVHEFNLFLEDYEEVTIEDFREYNEDELLIELFKYLIGSFENLTKVNYDEVNDIYSIDLKDNLVKAMQSLQQYCILARDNFLELAADGRDVVVLEPGVYYTVVYRIVKMVDPEVEDYNYVHETDSGYFIITDIDEGYGKIINFVEEGESEHAIYLENGKYYYLESVIIKEEEILGIANSRFSVSSLIKIDAVANKTDFIILGSDYKKNILDVYIGLLTTTGDSVELGKNLVLALKGVNNLFKSITNNVDSAPIELWAELLNILTVVKEPDEGEDYVDFNENLNNAFGFVVDLLLYEVDAMADLLTTVLCFEDSSVAYQDAKNYVEAVLVDIEQGDLDVTKAVTDLFELTKKYSTKNVSNVLSTIGVLYSIYFGDEEVSYNEIFEFIELPEGISIDYDKLIAKLRETNEIDVKDIIKISDINVEYVLDEQGNLEKEIFTITIDMNLDASIEAMEGFEDFVVAMINGVVTIEIELNI